AEFSNLRLMLDGQTLTGNLRLDAHGERPMVRGALQADRLDLNPYIERPAHPGLAYRPHDSEEWSAKPITLGLLHNLDADLARDPGPLRVRKLIVERAHIALSLADGRLAARLDPMTLYGGSGKATLDVDANARAPIYHNTLHFERVALGPFLAD